MLSMAILLFGMLFTLRETRAQSVTQPDDQVSVADGAPLQLRCNYSSRAAPCLFWYVQYPNKGLQLVLKYITGETLVKGTEGFEAEFKKSETSFHLRKPSAHWSDSAEYFCAVSDTVTETAGGAEHKPHET
uniref:Ig-like domain-containing protein n=1 Tax=Loxodonta africana TaxID=9785 RepID=G3TUG6_LOXAF